MLMHVEAFGLAAVGCLTTNFDNIMLVLSAGERLSALRCALTFAAVLVLAILAGFLLSLGVDAAVPSVIAWVGLIPLGMGLYELSPLGRSTGDTAKPAASAMSLALPLAANSLDTVAVQAALFTDLASAYHPAALAGSFSAAAALSAVCWYIITRPSVAPRLLPVAGKLRPWVLILVGVLLLMDTGFDAI